MKTTYSLNGKWKLYYDENHSETVKSPLEIGCLPVIDAMVPGNVEIDLANAGIIDADLYKGMATKQNEKIYKNKFLKPIRYILIFRYLNVFLISMILSIKFFETNLS